MTKEYYEEYVNNFYRAIESVRELYKKKWANIWTLIILRGYSKLMNENNVYYSGDS